MMSGRAGEEADKSRPTSQASQSTYQQNTRIQSMASVYSQADSYADRQSWQPAEPPESSKTSYAAGRHPIQTPAQNQHYSAVPSVVLSGDGSRSITPVQSTSAPPATTSHRAPSQIPGGHRIANFSRPVPPVIDGTEERKREVLMRNARMTPSPFPNSWKHESASPSIVPSIRVEDVDPVDAYTAMSAPPHQVAFAQQPYPNGMPRAASPSTNSLYSSYSYYPYDGNADSPNGSTPHLVQGQPPSAPSPTPSYPKQDSYELSSSDALSNPRTPQDFLQLGITHHIANRLKESAQCFEKSATLDKGCGVGMLMWGLTLRHGWGVSPNEEKGFKWLRKAAEDAVADLESAKAGMDTSAIKVSTHIFHHMLRAD